MLQRHNITGSEAETRDQNVPGYGAMHGPSARLRRRSRGWVIPVLLLFLILAVIVLIGVLATR